MAVAVEGNRGIGSREIDPAAPGLGIELRAKLDEWATVWGSQYNPSAPDDVLAGEEIDMAASRGEGREILEQLRKECGTEFEITPDEHQVESMASHTIEELTSEIVDASSPYVIPADGLSEEPVAKLVRSLEERGYTMFVLDRENHIRDKESLLAALERECDFPPYFGENWDAVYDCLCDLQWIPADGYVLILMRRDLIRHDPETYGVFLEILDDAGRFWRQQRGTPFKAIVPDVETPELCTLEE